MEPSNRMPRAPRSLCFVALSVLASLLVVAPTPSAATSCGGSVWEPTLDLAADVIFSGDVVTRATRSDLQVPAFEQVTIDVEKVWKGDISGRVIVTVQASGGRISDDRIVAANAGAVNVHLPADSYMAVFDCGGRDDDELRAALSAAGLEPHPPLTGPAPQPNSSSQKHDLRWVVGAMGLLLVALALVVRSRARPWSTD